MKKLNILVAIIIISAVSWFLASPLLIDKVVNEALPTHDELMAMPNEVREKTIQTITNKMAKMPDKATYDAMPIKTELVLLKQGEFKDTDAIHKGSGKALLYRLADGSHILRLQDFKVTNGPDLMVYLVKETNIAEADQVKAGYVNLGDLKGNVGNQNYMIPKNVNLSEYNSAVIWCELFGVLFSPASLANLQ